MPASSRGCRSAKHSKLPIRGRRAFHQRRAKPVQQKQETRGRKCYECPATNVVPQEIAVDQIESQQAQERNRRSYAFFPPGDNHSDHYADWKEKKPSPFVG